MFIYLTHNKPLVTRVARAIIARYQAGFGNRPAMNSGVVTDSEGEVILDTKDEGVVCVDANGVLQHLKIRKLTPKECWRLQGFPDDYFDKAKAAGVSDTQLYKQAGNAVTVNVAEAIGKRLMEIEMAEKGENT